MTKQYLSNKLSDLEQIASLIIDENPKSKVFLFYGQMGAGKTTLIKEIVKYLGIDDVANSPTFALVNQYHSDLNGEIFHFDFYRLNSQDEAYDMGYEEYFYSGAYCFVEWPEKISSLLPDDATIIKIDLKGQKRVITIQ